MFYEVHDFSCPEKGDDPMNTERSLATDVWMNGMEEMCQYPYGNWDGREERKEKHSDLIANCIFQIEIIGFKGIYFLRKHFLFLSLFYLLHLKTLFTPARKLSHTWRNHPGFTFPRTFYYLCLLLYL